MARLKIYSGITSVEITPNKIPSPTSAELLCVMKNFDLIRGKDQTFNLIRHRYALACNLVLNIHYVIPREISTDVYYVLTRSPINSTRQDMAVEMISYHGIFLVVITVN